MSIATLSFPATILTAAAGLMPASGGAVTSVCTEGKNIFPPVDSSTSTDDAVRTDRRYLPSSAGDVYVASGHLKDKSFERHWSSVNHLNPPSASDLARWSDFLSSLSAESPLRAQVARRFWERLLTCAPSSPLPVVYRGEDDVVVIFRWDTPRYLLEAEILASGEYEWFFKDRQTGETDGTEATPNVGAPTQLCRFLSRFV